MSIIDKINYDPEYEAWLGKVKLSGFESCGILWDCDASYLSEAYEKSEPNNGPVMLQLQIESVDGKPPTKEQEAAFEYLCANENPIAKAALTYAFQQCKSAYYSESLPETKTLQGEKRELRKRLNTLDGFCELVEPNTITILSEHKNKVAYIAFDFRTSLDYEHGFSILTHRRKAMNWAGAGERGGGPPIIQPANEDDIFQSWLESEERYFDLVTKITDLSSVEQFAEDLAINESESFLNDNRYGRELSNKPNLNQKISNLIEKRIKIFQRIKKQSPEAFDILELILDEAIEESEIILEMEHKERIAKNE